MNYRKTGNYSDRIIKHDTLSNYSKSIFNNDFDDFIQNIDFKGSDLYNLLQNGVISENIRLRLYNKNNGTYGKSNDYANPLYNVSYTQPQLLHEFNNTDLSSISMSNNGTIYLDNSNNAYFHGINNNWQLLNNYYNIKPKLIENKTIKAIDIKKIPNNGGELLFNIMDENNDIFHTLELDDDLSIINDYSSNIAIKNFEKYNYNFKIKKQGKFVFRDNDVSNNFYWAIDMFNQLYAWGDLYKKEQDIYTNHPMYVGYG